MKVSLPQLNKTLTCDKGENLFRVLKDNGIPIASSCNGDGICGKCLVSIDSSDADMPPMTELEEKWKAKNHFDKDQRLSCQLPVTTNLIVKTTYW
ncbi:MAG: 2Fe-2S iron-sulfur cluster binding domain-containing protein [Bdellovibrionales bacterium]|nr:2Fe-2S iron-sulfur cluster binding domain-containing protein [Bdellovibrionales bacterium]